MTKLASNSSNYKITVSVEPHYPIKKTVLLKACEAALEGAKVKSKTEVSISVIGDRKMRQLNKDFRGKDETTDVLAFPHSLDSGKPNPFPTPPSKYLNLGDVIISYPQLIQRAAKEEMMVDDMARFLVIHGVLHLLGFDHEKPEEEVEMEKLEDQILSQFQLT